MLKNIIYNEQVKVYIEHWERNALPQCTIQAQVNINSEMVGNLFESAEQGHGTSVRSTDDSLPVLQSYLGYAWMDVTEMYNSTIVSRHITIFTCSISSEYNYYSVLLYLDVFVNIVKNQTSRNINKAG